MKIIITGSAGHLGEALVRTLLDHDTPNTRVIGVDRLATPFTSEVGDLTDRGFVQQATRGADVIIHTATLHKPHVATHTRQDFVDSNITATLNLLEEAVRNNCSSFIFTSTTSTFGRALSAADDRPASWITEDVAPIPKNIYGVTKVAAEDLCELMHRLHGLPCLILRTSRFFPEEDDLASTRQAYDDLNSKVNELLYRRVDLQDAVDAHLLAMQRAPDIGFARLIISATTPFTREQAPALRQDTPGVLSELVNYRAEYERRGWSMFPGLDRVYDNSLARELLGWEPNYTFAHALELLARDEHPLSPLSVAVGKKGYHAGEAFDVGPYPTRD